MGRELTARYAELFDNWKVKNPFRFVRDVVRHGKLSESISFVVWEIMHQLRLFPRRSYLQFTNSQPIRLTTEPLDTSAFEENLTRFFSARGLSITRSEIQWKLLFITAEKAIYGCIYPNDHDLYQSIDDGESIEFVKSFPAPIKSIYVSGQGTLFVCVKGAVYRSIDNGSSFERVLELGSYVSYFRHNNAMTETPDGTLVVGEYGNIWDENGWRKLAYLYFSNDNGATWTRSDALIHLGINKHVHLVAYSRSLDRLFMADGDNKKKLWISNAPHTSDISDLYTWHPITKYHIQMGGYTSVVETGDKMMFGTDYQGGTNFLVETTDGKKYTKQVVPDPYRRSPIDNMVLRAMPNGNEIWANLPFSTARTKCLLMYSDDGGNRWHRVIEYSRARHKVWLLSTATTPAEQLYLAVEDTKNAIRWVYKISP